jgi:hypothetical protein
MMMMLCYHLMMFLKIILGSGLCGDYVHELAP